MGASINKEVVLADGQTLIVREPKVSQDLEKLVDFFSKLPAAVRNHLRYNVTDIDFCQTRLKQINGIDHWRLIAELDGKIVADATMDREPFGWTRHVAELRSVVDPRFDGLGIESVLLNQLVNLGANSKIEQLYTEVHREQTGLIQLLEKEGFVFETVRKKYAKDLEGKLHDVVIMSNDLEVVWKALAEHLEEMDIKLSRIYPGT